MVSLSNITPASALGSLSTLAGLLTSSKRIDVVKILNQQTMAQVFQAARPMKAHVNETSKVSKYPVETGYTSADNRVSNPTEIEMDFFIPSSAYATAYTQMRTAWAAGTLLSVQTRTGTYKNLIIENLPHEEDPDMSSAIMMHVKFSEFIIAANSSNGTSLAIANFSPAKPQAANTLSLGLLQGLGAVGSIGSYLKAGKVLGI